MDARAKLEGLRRQWVVYAVFVAILEAFREGFDSQWLLRAALRIGVTFGLAWYLTTELDRRSSLVWAFGVVFGLLGAIARAIQIIEMLVGAGRGGGLDLGALLLAAGSGYIHIQTFRVLRDPQVKRHVMLD